MTEETNCLLMRVYVRCSNGCACVLFFPDHAGGEVTLEGWESFDAAVHCAAISAGQRQKRNNRMGYSLQAPRKVSNGTGVLRRMFSKSSHNGEVQ